MNLLIRLLGSVFFVLVAACAKHPGDFPVSHNEVSHCYPAVIPQLAGRLEMHGHEVADYFSEELILKRPLGDLREWSGKFDVEEGDSDWNSWVEIRFVQGNDEKTGKKVWLASGTFLDGWDESKAVSFARAPVLMLDEDGSAFFKIGPKRCYLFRHKTRGCILVIESGFYEKTN